MSRFYQNSDMVPLPADEPAATDDQLPGGAEGGTASAAGSPSPDGTAGQPATDDLPEKLKEIRSAPERQMYDAVKQYQNVFQRGTIHDTLAAEDPEAVAALDEFAANVYSDMRLSNPEAQTVHSVFTTPVTDESAAAWRAESEAYIRSLGAEGREKLALAQELARRDPKVHEILKSTAYGNHPKLVRLLIEKAQAERRDGRL